MLRKYQNKGRSTLCYNFLLGRCNRTDCKFAHVRGAEIPGEFSKDLIEVIKPGVEAIVNEGAQRSSNGNDRQRGGEGSNKRQRTGGGRAY